MGRRSPIRWDRLAVGLALLSVAIGFTWCLQFLTWGLDAPDLPPEEMSEVDIDRYRMGSCTLHQVVMARPDQERCKLSRRPRPCAMGLRYRLLLQPERSQEWENRAYEPQMVFAWQSSNPPHGPKLGKIRFTYLYKELPCWYRPDELPAVPLRTAAKVYYWDAPLLSSGARTALHLAASSLHSPRMSLLPVCRTAVLLACRMLVADACGCKTREFAAHSGGRSARAAAGEPVPEGGRGAGASDDQSRGELVGGASLK